MDPEGSLQRSQRPTTFPILSQINPLYVPILFLVIPFKSNLQPKSRFSKWVLSFGFPNQNPVCTSAVPYICHVLLYLVYFLFVHPNGTKYRLQSCSLRSLLRSPVTPVFLDPKIFLSTLFSNTLSLCSFLNLRH